MIQREDVVSSCTVHTTIHLPKFPEGRSQTSSASSTVHSGLSTTRDLRVQRKMQRGSHVHDAAIVEPRIVIMNRTAHLVLIGHIPLLEPQLTLSTKKQHELHHPGTENNTECEDIIIEQRITAQINDVEFATTEQTNK